ncbi:hypothetical protein BBK36DRAFT_1137917 [Trichoderma citrinoviride]|uniref:Uncharacterized protein n=1 Tax=Trichoderma citrinoviride TaxID=58853 RepID=A0A2T4BJQ0_9HYPO|nr:hypothetical protein BBK36DRAFT_1137917 [Trichoderma citrinoviride]PTB69489.1 hypothetical protein BBK36DRAFT_1137917 [Trichoderma citrinoviride]
MSSDDSRTTGEATDRTIGEFGRRASCCYNLSSPVGRGWIGKADTSCRASERVCEIPTNVEETGQRRDKDLEARDARLTGSHMNGLHVRRAAALRSSGESRLWRRRKLVRGAGPAKRYKSQSQEKDGHDRDNLEVYCRRGREMHAKHGSAACPGWRETARRLEAVSMAGAVQIACYAAIERRAGVSYLYRAWSLHEQHPPANGSVIAGTATPRCYRRYGHPSGVLVPRLSTAGEGQSTSTTGQPNH